MLVLSALTFILMEHVMSVNGNSTLMPYESLVAENFALNSTSFSPTFVKESVTESSNFVQNLLESVNDWNRDGNDNSSTYYAHVPSMFSYGTYCTRWRPTNHIFFQLANMCLFLSHLAPIGLYGLVFLRLMLMAASAFLCAWSFGVICMYDSFVWNTMFVVINAAHMCVLLYYIRPIRFSSEVEEVYEALFRPLKVSRAKFQKVLGCMKMIRTLKYQEVYAQEKATKVDSLSLVLSGKLVVSQGGRALHIVFPHQFLDSPEWFGVSTDEYFQVSITAMEWSRVLIWHRDKLRLSIITDQFLQAVFDHILGRDVVKKLMQVSETMAASNNGHVPNMEDIDDKPILIVKKQGDGPGITALINRQLQVEEHAPLLAASSALYSRCVSSTRPGIGIIYTTDSSASATDPAVSI